MKYFLFLFIFQAGFLFAETPSTVKLQGKTYTLATAKEYKKIFLFTGDQDIPFPRNLKTGLKRCVHYLTLPLYFSTIVLPAALGIGYAAITGDGVPMFISFFLQSPYYKYFVQTPHFNFIKKWYWHTSRIFNEKRYLPVYTDLNIKENIDQGIKAFIAKEKRIITSEKVFETSFKSYDDATNFKDYIGKEVVLKEYQVRKLEIQNDVKANIISIPHAIGYRVYRGKLIDVLESNDNYIAFLQGPEGKAYPVYMEKNHGTPTRFRDTIHYDPGKPPRETVYWKRSFYSIKQDSLFSENKIYPVFEYKKSKSLEGQLVHLKLFKGYGDPVTEISAVVLEHKDYKLKIRDVEKETERVLDLKKETVRLELVDVTQERRDNLLKEIDFENDDEVILLSELTDGNDYDKLLEDNSLELRDVENMLLRSQAILKDNF
ncbi:MAG: hypothetical protein H6621_07530 [Halobacteriovoraceae bacterium]|nr:hypothetical protein [Halobacteriovoraceae bacterium]